MSIVLRTTSAATPTQTLQLFAERTVKGMHFADYNNLNVSGVSLATAKLVSMGLKLPQDLNRGNVAARVNYRMPLANRADGGARYCLFESLAFLPADATLEEKSINAFNLYEVFSATEVYQDLLANLKIAI